jgi:hypothetical protein
VINQLDRWAWSLVLVVVGWFVSPPAVDTEQALCDAAGGVAYASAAKAPTLPTPTPVKAMAVAETKAAAEASQPAASETKAAPSETKASVAETPAAASPAPQPARVVQPQHPAYQYWQPYYPAPQVQPYRRYYRGP